MLICDKCGARINEGSNFCPQCGDLVTEADRVDTPIRQDEVATVEITFTYSTSANYQKAVDICQNLPTYKTTGEGKEMSHAISLPLTEIELIITIFDLVGNWKSASMLINGQRETKAALTRGCLGCYRERQKSHNSTQYCFGENQYDLNIWGCKRLRMPLMQWGEGWLEHGQLDGQGVWYFDKAKIQHELEVAIHENLLCPVLKQASIIATLDKLPDTIDPKTDPHWEYRTTYENVHGKVKHVAIGIKPILKQANYYVIGDYKPTWTLSEPDERITEDIPSPKPLNGRSPKKQAETPQWAYSCFTIIIIAIIIFGLFIYLGTR